MKCHLIATFKKLTLRCFLTSAQFIDDRKEVSVPKKGATIAKALSPLGFSLDLRITRITRPDHKT